MARSLLERVLIGTGAACGKLGTDDGRGGSTRVGGLPSCRCVRADLRGFGTEGRLRPLLLFGIALILGGRLDPMTPWPSTLTG